MKNAPSGALKIASKRTCGRSSRNFLVVRILILSLVLGIARPVLGGCAPDLYEHLARIHTMISENDFNVERSLGSDWEGYNDGTYVGMLNLDIAKKRNLVKEKLVDSEMNVYELTPEFAAVSHLEILYRLRHLKKGEVCVDLGAGFARALQSFLKDNNEATAVAISYQKPIPNPERPKTVKYAQDLSQALKKYEDRFKYIEMDLEKASAKDLPKADALIDAIGYLTYTKNMSHALELVHGMLRNPVDSSMHLALPAHSTFFYKGTSEVPLSLTAGEMERSPDFINFSEFVKHHTTGLAITDQNLNIVVNGESTDAFRIIKTEIPFSSAPLGLVKFDYRGKFRIFRILPDKN